jgi:hypothetical protein
MVAATAKSEQALKCSDAAQNMRLTGSTRTVSTSETMGQMLLHKHETYKYKNWIHIRNVDAAIQNHPKQNHQNNRTGLENPT